MNGRGPEREGQDTLRAEMEDGVRVVVGLPVYNGAENLREALESILSQTYTAFVVVAVDDCSCDDSARIVNEYAAFDERIVLTRNDRRLGITENWRSLVRLASAKFTNVEYFAWASDHDVWHPRWLAALVSELDACPAAVLAYPGVVGLGGTQDRKYYRSRRQFGSRRAAKEVVGIGYGVGRAPAGSMVYGLFRIDALRKAGIFRNLLMPDRLLLAEISLYGQIRCISELLWYRRYRFHTEKQRTRLFADRVPLHAYLPWWLVHCSSLFWSLCLMGYGRPECRRLAGLRYSLGYLRHALSRAR